jgi:membrane-associated phospholipid phosphatase
MYLKRILITLFLGFITAIVSYAQEQDTTFKQSSGLKEALLTPIKDVSHVGKSLTNFSEKEWKGLYIAGTSTLQFMLFFDKPIDQWIKKRPQSVAGVVWRDIARLGHTYDDLTPDRFTVLLAGSMLTGGLILNDDYALRTAGMLVETQLLTTFTTSLFKHSFGRKRPYSTDNPMEFDPFTFDEIRVYIDFPRGKDPRNSFISGHTSGIFAMMTIISKRYDYWYVKIPAYTYATSVAINRMNNPSHWASDVIFGAVVGYFIGDKISERERITQLEKKMGMNIIPKITEHGLGIELRF